jgi:hypothetical protein
MKKKKAHIVFCFVILRIGLTALTVDHRYKHHYEFILLDARVCVYTACITEDRISLSIYQQKKKKFFLVLINFDVWSHVMLVKQMSIGFFQLLSIKTFPLTVRFDIAC